MVLNCILLILGIALVLWGADRFTDGACGIARKWHVSELVIGLTIVSMGTSLPEFMVSFFSVLRGSSDMSVGNIIGSNIFNTLVIIGASAIMSRLSVNKLLLTRDIPISLAVALLLFVMAFFDGFINRAEGIVMCAIFIAYLSYTYYLARKDKANISDSFVEESAPTYKLVLLLLVGCACLVMGGNLLVENAAELAWHWGVSESVIGLTILAGGTSLPELATSLVAARKGSNGLALGNAIGSNVFNVAFVIGLCSSIVPMKVTDISTVDWIVLLGSAVLLWVVAFTGRKLSRLEGVILIGSYILYILYIIGI